MRARQSPVESLVLLPKLSDAVERRARFRQAVAALGQELRVDGPPPLDDVPVEALVRAAQTLLESGLIDDLDWIHPGAAAVALYELSSALPPGRERREIGRRVLARLFEGNAATFAAVATRMALGSGRPFEAATLRARIGLVFNLPIGTSVNADPLALVLVSRRELFDRWISKAASGPLPARLLAARLFQLASREAVRRAGQGDPHPANVFLGSPVKPVFDGLLMDREPLVWRQAAMARGILSTALPNLRQDIELALDATLSPTEWRRAAVSLVACASTDAATAMKQCERLIDGEIVARDPGLFATMVWGLPPVIEAEPEAAEELLDRLCLAPRPDVAEALSSLLSDVANPEFGAGAAARMQKLLKSQKNGGDPAMHGILEDTLRALDRERSSGGVHAAVRRALTAYENGGARPAYELALDALSRATTTMDALEALVGPDTPLADLLGPLHDLDSSAIERSRLHDLLLVGRSVGDTNATVPEMERLYERLGTFILDREESIGDGEYSHAETIARQRTLRALLHLVDLDTSTRAEVETDAVKARVRRTIVVLLGTLAGGPDASLHRIICATLARSLDAAVREALADPADLLLAVMDRIVDAHSLQAMREASTHPDVRDVISAYGRFVQRMGREGGAAGTEPPPDPGESVPPEQAPEARAFLGLSHGIGTNGSYRGEALRQVVLRIARALESISAARGLSELVEPPSGDGYPLGDLQHLVSSFRQLLIGARRRVLGNSARPEIEIIADIPEVSAIVERAVSGIPPNRPQFVMSLEELTADLPAPIASAIGRACAGIVDLPVAAPKDVPAIPLQTRRAELPDWLLPRRTIGAFYVVRALGAGGVSSVFVSRRIEERHTLGAELYALKVPHYDPTTARSLSESEFMQLFREEAGALLSLPQHPNLARFVTFDLAARPKPILVMELIHGFGLDRLVKNRSLSTSHAIGYLAGILSGLEAMHSVGVGHLDVKPSNVILRSDGTPVLVDFGLSGRHLRPGCGTLEYSAPEILGVVLPGAKPSPANADVYAFACTAFEVLTGTLLFDADDELSLMDRHVEHDGWPEKLSALAAKPEYSKVASMLAACLRRDPSLRPSAAVLRPALVEAAARLVEAPWPLGRAAAAAPGLRA